MPQAARRAALASLPCHGEGPPAQPQAAPGATLARLP